MVYLDAQNLPSHIGIIMDGNGRWAQLRGQERTEGHREGSNAVRKIVRCARRLGVKALTLYAFSEQNWARPGQEVEALMGLLRDFFVSERTDILENRIRLNAVGRVDRLPPQVRTVLESLRAESAEHDGMTLTLALSYGGREEIAAAAQSLARAVAAGTLKPEDVTEEALHERIPSVMEVGDPDLVIRTGGERRISNFLLYGLAYAELHFTDVLWPEFAESDLYEAIASYQGRERRFGLVGKAADPLLLQTTPPPPPLDEAVASGLRLVG